MKKVYIPIIVVVFAACIFTSIQWQVTNSNLQASQEDVQFLTSEVEQLHIVTAQQQTEIQEQESLIEDQEVEMERKDIQISRLVNEVEIVKFQFYYASLSKQRYGWRGLEDYLSRWEWVEGIYLPNEFDCSEMSAYLEWRLENEGYHTIIVVGNAPGGGDGHAWLLVETSVHQYTPVEATTYRIVDWSNPFFDDYFVYEYQFETIQEALYYSATDFDWWN